MEGAELRSTNGAPGVSGGENICETPETRTRLILRPQDQCGWSLASQNGVMRLQGWTGALSHSAGPVGTDVCFLW